MTSSDGLNVRLATANDYKAVLDINRNVYDGFDYLASMYFYFLHHPDVLLFVAELDGKIVSTRVNLYCHSVSMFPPVIMCCRIINAYLYLPLPTYEYVDDRAF